MPACGATRARPASVSEGADPLHAPPCAPPDFAPRAPQLRLPADACDTHAHVLGPAARYPFAAARVYTPPDCVYEAYRHMLDTVGISRAVIVQPSVYGADNRLLIDTLRRDPQRLRGVAVFDAGITDAELGVLDAAGVRGVRVNLVDRVDRAAALPLEALRVLAQRVAPLGWHLELLAHVDQHADQLLALQDLAVPVVFGHFGYMTPGRGTDDPGFRALLDLVRSGRAWVKLTGPYRLTRTALPYVDVDAMAAALRELWPDRLLWGSDWPHVMLRGAMPNDAQLVDLLARWLPSDALQRQVLVDNPRHLYRFAA